MTSLPTHESGHDAAVPSHVFADAKDPEDCLSFYELKNQHRTRSWNPSGFSHRAWMNSLSVHDGNIIMISMIVKAMAAFFMGLILFFGISGG